MKVISTPFFSVLLPTKDRSELLADAVRSVLDQDFTSLELIIVDNDDVPGPTAEATRVSDSRLRYFRTGGLPMHSNWAYGLSKAVGRYLIVLEDKMRLAPGALEILHRQLCETPEDVIVFSTPYLDDGGPPRPLRVPPRRIRSDSAIADFARFRPAALEALPKGFNCSTPLALLSDHGLGFVAIAPDYSLAFQLLSVVDDYLYLPTPLAYVPHRSSIIPKYSQGFAWQTKDPGSRRFLSQSGVTEAEIISRVPIKTPWIWINPILYDFFTKYRGSCRVNWADYYALCVYIVVSSRRSAREQLTAIVAAFVREPTGLKIAALLSTALLIGHLTVSYLKRRLVRQLGVSRLSRTRA